MKKTRQFIEWTTVWTDKRRKNTVRFLELKELRLLNQFFDEDLMECFEIRVKEEISQDEFDKIKFG